MTAPLACRLEGTIEEMARGLGLRDRDGMWWRLRCDADIRPFLTETVRIAGARTADGVIEVWHVTGLV